MIYVGIPAHDERHTIGPLLWRIRQLLTGTGRDFRILALDDGSSDGTSERLAAYRRVLPLTVLDHGEPRGYAASLERLVREAVARSDYPKRDALVTLQADFTDAPEAIPRMVRKFEGGADLVTCAARPASGSDDEAEDDEPASRREPTPPPRSVRLARRTSRLLTSGIAVPAEVTDPLGTLRLYRLFTLERAIGELADPDTPLLSGEGWAANLELLMAAWPHVRSAARVTSAPDYGRRYRPTRFRAFPALWSLGRTAHARRWGGGRSPAPPG